MTSLLARLRYDPVPRLLSCSDSVLGSFVRKELLDQEVDIPSSIWKQPVVVKLIRRQQSDGSWTCSAGRIRNEASNYRLIESWKALRLLIDQYGLVRDHPSIHRAAEFVFSCQSTEGDFRGFLANQYATYYTGALMGLLIKAGYADDSRIAKGFKWLLSMRQNDGGWSVPIITHKLSLEQKNTLTRRFVDPVMPDRTKPFSHTCNGMVLRAFAAHPAYRRSDEAKRAAALQKTRFFQKDCYTSYQSAGYWVKFQYPFWWNNLVASLDSISLIDERIDDRTGNAVQWLVDHQERDGLWNTSYAEQTAGRGPRVAEQRLWVTYAICRVLKRMRGR